MMNNGKNGNGEFCNNCGDELTAATAYQRRNGKTSYCKKCERAHASRRYRRQRNGGRHEKRPEFVLPPGCRLLNRDVQDLRLLDWQTRSRQDEFGIMRSPEGWPVVKDYPDLGPGEVNFILC